MPLPELRAAPEAVRRAYAVILEAVEETDTAFGREYGLEGLPQHDILVAYLILSRDLRCNADARTSHELQMRRTLSTARLLVARAFTAKSHSMSSVRLVVDLVLAYPQDAHTLTDVVSLINSDLAWPTAATTTDDLGLLTRVVYDAAYFTLLASRPVYLRSRILTHQLSPAQRDIATVLSSEWDGTLQELIDTAKALRPDVPLASAIEQRPALTSPL
jgi:hypothetical protein